MSICRLPILGLGRSPVHANTAFLVYEHLITLEAEVRLFWVRRLTGATALFAINRYVALLIYTMNVAGVLPIPAKVNS